MVKNLARSGAHKRDHGHRSISNIRICLLRHRIRMPVRHIRCMFLPPHPHARRRSVDLPSLQSSTVPIVGNRRLRLRGRRGTMQRKDDFGNRPVWLRGFICGIGRNGDAAGNARRAAYDMRRYRMRSRPLPFARIVVRNDKQLSRKKGRADLRMAGLPRIISFRNRRPSEQGIHQ